MNTTEGVFEMVIIAGLYAVTVFVIGLIRDLRWRGAGDARPRYPSLLGTALLGLVLLMPVYWLFRAAEPEGQWQRFSHELPIPLAPPTARNFSVDCLSRLQGADYLALTLGYSGSDLDPALVHRCLTVELILTPVSPAPPEGELVNLFVTLAQTARASVAIEQRLPRLEAAFSLLTDVEQCLWLLTPSQPRDLKQVAVRQLERTLGAAPASLHSDRVDTFYLRIRQQLGDMAMAETDPDLRQDIQKVRTLIPDSHR